MGLRHLLLLPLLLASITAAVADAASVHGEASTAFIDGAPHRYLRNQQVDDDQDTTMSLKEVSAAVSVLLGFAPATSLSAFSSAQLNKVLLPNPFDRPRAVFILQIDGSHASAGNFVPDASSSFSTRIEGVNNAATGLTDKDELIVIHSDESLDVSGSDYLDNELSNLANWLEGLYQKSNGKLIIPLQSGSGLILQLDKEADLKFASSLVSLRKTIQRGIQVHEDFSGVVSPAELLVCHFTGIKALNDEYGSTEIVKEATEVVQTAFTKGFDSLQGAYKGKIVGLVISTKEASPSLGAIIGAPSSSRNARLLEEASPTNATEASVLLVRKSLAWITGIILLVSTLIGVCLLMNMPLTKDTLLYSNVKID